MEREINSFHFEGSKIREITDSKGNPWFVARDICDILGFERASDALRGLDNDEKLIRRLCYQVRLAMSM